jgi:hypothetical protein
LKRKKIKQKQNFSDSPEYFKIEKTCFAQFLVFEREKLQYVFVPSEAKIHTDFYQGHFDLLNWTLGSQVKNF